MINNRLKLKFNGSGKFKNISYSRIIRYRDSCIYELIKDKHVIGYQVFNIKRTPSIKNKLVIRGGRDIYDFHSPIIEKIDDAMQIYISLRKAPIYK